MTEKEYSEEFPESSAGIEDLIELRSILENLKSEVESALDLCSKTISGFQSGLCRISWKTLQRTAENIADGCARAHTAEFEFRSRIRTDDANDIPVYTYRNAALMEKLSREKYRVRVVYDGDKIMAKLPLLEGSKNRHLTHEATARNHFFCQELRMQVRKLLTEHPELYRMDAHKTVCCIFVRNIADKTTMLRDSDNYFTKPVTDAFTDYLGGDEPLSCDFFFKTIESETLETGTYILLFRRNDLLPVKELETILHHIA